MSYSRYDVCWVNFEPVRGSEMSKTRPAVIVSLDALNSTLKTVVVCPITSQIHPSWRSRLQIRVKGRAGEIAVDQIRSVAKERLGKKIQTLPPGDAAVLRQLLSDMYGEP
jgi:mRNA interferase MazF